MTEPSRGRQTITEIFAVLRDCDLSATEVRLWGLYRSYDSKGKGAFVSDSRIAGHMGKSERTVERARASLIEKGFLNQQLRGPGIARYWSVLPAERSDTDGDTSSDTSGEASAKDPTHVPTHDPTPVSPTIRMSTGSTGSTDNTPPNPADGEGDWKAFKNTYPQRSGEQGWVAAEQLWKENIAAGVVASDMLAGAMRYAAWCNAEGKAGTHYVLMPANWLHPAKRRWQELWPITESTKANDNCDGPPASVKGGPANWIPSEREVTNYGSTAA